MNLHIQETKSKCEFQPYEQFKPQVGQVFVNTHNTFYLSVDVEIKYELYYFMK